MIEFSWLDDDAAKAELLSSIKTNNNNNVSVAVAVDNEEFPTTTVDECWRRSLQTIESLITIDNNNSTSAVTAAALADDVATIASAAADGVAQCRALFEAFFELLSRELFERVSPRFFSYFKTTVDTADTSTTTTRRLLVDAISDVIPIVDRYHSLLELLLRAATSSSSSTTSSAAHILQPTTPPASPFVVKKRRQQAAAPPPSRPSSSRINDEFANNCRRRLNDILCATFGDDSSSTRHGTLFVESIRDFFRSQFSEFERFRRKTSSEEFDADDDDAADDDNDADEQNNDERYTLILLWLVFS
jgi:hypothetical protein